jgi:hypothetical protein
MTKARIRFTAVLTIIVSFMAMVPSAKADPLGGLAVGAGLTILGNKINEAVEKAIGGGEILEIQAGGQVSLLVQQALQSFDNEKNLTFAQLNGEEQNALNSVVTVANDFLKKANNDMAEIENRAQAIAHVLPFSSNFPQAWKIMPSYFEKNGAAPLRVSMVGDFHDIVDSDLDATLTLSSKNYKNAEKDSGRLTFDIPMADLASEAARPTENVFTVTVPYKKRCWLFFHCTKDTTFKGSSVALPLNLADVSIAVTTTTPGIVTNPLSRGYFEQESGDDDIKCGGEHADQAVHVAYPDSGWRVQPSSVTWNKVWSQGNEGVDQDYWLAQNCSSTTTACLCVSTEHHRAGTSGKVHAWILFTEEKDVLNSQTTQTPVTVGWGESRVVQIPTGATWAGTYTKYDGKVIQFAGPYDDDFIKVAQTGSIVTISTAPWGTQNMEKLREVLRTKFKMQ